MKLQFKIYKIKIANFVLGSPHYFSNIRPKYLDQISSYFPIVCTVKCCETLKKMLVHAGHHADCCQYEL